MNLTHEQALDLAAGYVLGALDPDEEQAVREHLASCPESHAEFEELGGAVAVLAASAEQVEPPASLRTRVLEAAAAELAARGAGEAGPELGPAASITPPPSIPFPSPAERDARAAERAERIREGVEPERRGSSRGAWLLRLAAVVAIVALGAWNLVLQRDLAASRDYQAGVAAVLDVANDAGATVAILSAATGGGPSGIAAVGADGRVAVAMRDLASLTGTEVYEAWVIADEGAGPIPIGGFKPGPNGTGTFVSGPTPATAGVTVALTREPAPGATAPTMPILSIGQATPPPDG